MFGGSCIGVILLVMALEMSRRAVKEYDRYLVRKHTMTGAPASTPAGSLPNSGDASPKTNATACVTATGVRPFRPNVLEQAVRALLHMIQFATAYFIMLLAMYYNGYIIICIFIGAFLGSFVFQWEMLGGGAPTSAAQEATVCCG